MHHHIRHIAGSLLFTMAFAMIAGAQSRIDPFADDDILEAVESDLRSDEALSPDLLDVTVDAGVVTLSGDVFTLISKRRAVQIASHLRGVRAVVDQIQVLPSNRRDSEILADVHAAMRDDPVVDKDEIRADVDQGVVVLEGIVDSLIEKHLAESVIGGVRGVRAIDNRIAINVSAVRRDDEIRPEILSRLELSPFVSEDRIRVGVRDSAVTLEGTVGSLLEKERARSLCWVPGVREVDSAKLTVDSSLNDRQRRYKITKLRNDIQLQRAVEDALLYDPRVRGTGIRVRVRQATVTLLGNVSTLTARRAAEGDARNTLGVRRVINHLKVRDKVIPNDVAITEKAQQALARDAHLADLDLRPSCHFGKLYVSGAANSQFEKERAEAVLANVPGATAIVNRIRVEREWKPKPDAEIQEDVERRLRWSPVLDLEQIRVTVRDGTATLEGTVDTPYEQSTAVRHCLQGGAKDVDDQLEVRSRRTTPAGLKATLLANQAGYEVTAKQTGEKFRRFLESARQLDDPKSLPPAPQVDLVLRLENEGDGPLEVRLGHDRGAIEMSLTGEGAVHVPMRQSFIADFRPGQAVIIDPGKRLDIPIRSLDHGFRNVSDRWYWTEEGTYMLQVTLVWPSDETGFRMKAVAATPVELRVTSAAGS